MSNFDIGGLNGSQNYSGFVDSADSNDLYKFSLSKTGSFSLSLNGLSANTDVQLLNSNGNVLYSSTANGKNPEAISVDDLAPGNYSVRVFRVSGKTNYNLHLTLDEKGNTPGTNSSVDPISGLKIESGYFTVGQTGEISFDFVNDDSTYQSELAIFSLSGMDKFVPGSAEFTKEAANRALSNSVLGHVVISDFTEKAKFNVSLNNKNYNDGQYLGLKKFAMNPGDKFGVMLVPDGKVQEVFNNPDIAGKKRALFSLKIANPSKTFTTAAIAAIDGTGTAFAIEDRQLDSGADKDYNDLIFKVTGATGLAVGLDGAIDPKKDWRGTVAGKELIDYLIHNPNQPITYPKAAEPVSALTPLLKEYQAYLQKGATSQFQPTESLLQVDNNRVLIEAYATGNVNNLLTDLQNLGLQEPMTFGRGVSGWLPIEAISKLANLESLQFATPAYKPISQAGQATNQADTAIKANQARNLGVDGTGMKVGVISDSYNNLGTAASDIASGDLPSNVELLKDQQRNGTDEGRAMLQLVHDIAPGSKLAFHTGNGGGQIGFANAIKNLGQAGSNVIVDDLQYLNEPMFQDGVIAQAVDEVVSKGVSYFASAGNHGRISYESGFRSGTTIADGSFGNSNFIGGVAHDFDPGSGVDIFQRITIQENSTFQTVFQWDQTFASVSGTGSQSDLNIYLLDASQTKVLASSIINNLGQDPFEMLNYKNLLGSGQTEFNLLITKKTGVAPSLMKYVVFQGEGKVSIKEYDTASSTVYGHYNAVGTQTVGSAYYWETPEFGTNPAKVTNSSSPGGTPILFDKNGNRLANPDNRQKVRIVAPHGTNTTFFGTDINDPDTFPNFFGTSAAAPHAAAVAALMLQAAPGTTPKKIYETLEQTALDMDDPKTAGFDVGFDYATGYGLILADKAVQALTKPIPPKSTINLSVTDNSASEKYSWETQDPGQFTITRTGGDNSKAETIYYTLGGTAKNSEDYSQLFGSVTFAAGATNAIIPITVLDDSTYEGTENHYLSLSSNSAYNLGSTSSGTVAIADNEILKSTINLSVTDGSASEKYSWETQDPGQFTVTRTGGDNSKAETVYYTLGGTAKNSEDYSQLSGSVTFAAGAISVGIPINIVDDSTYEGTENLTLTLSSNTAYNLGSTSSGTVAIIDNETPPKSTINLSVTDNSASEKYSWETQDPGQFTITRTGGDNSKAETVYYTLGGTAKNSEDYNQLSGSVIFAAGAISVGIPISIVDDSIYEGTENPILTLSTNSAYNLGSTTSGTVAIADNDLAPNIVTNTNDSGLGSLRAAIEFANKNPGKDTIQFNIAKSDPGYNSTTGAFTIKPTSALPMITDSVIIDGTTQIGFVGKPIIELNGSSAGTGVDGLQITAGYSTVKGLVINRFSGDGIELSGSGGNVIIGNYIGTNVTGAVDLGNSLHGVYIKNAPNNIIGGTGTEARNLISGNDALGVVIEGISASGNQVLGNYIGTDVNGTAILGNYSHGVLINNAPNNTIGGTVAGSRNIISGNGGNGIAFANSSATGNKVLGNYIGTKVDGISPLGNSKYGVVIGASNNTIGGTSLNAGNTIAFNGSNGVLSFSSVSNSILSNSIFSNSSIGIDLGGGLGVDLNLNGVTPNDTGDSDTGPNNLQNFPVLTSASTSSNSTTVKGTLNSTPNSTFRVEFFTNSALDPSGYGEGEKFIGFQNVTTDSSGNASFTVDLPTSVTTGKFITATATDSNNNTSEFSQGTAVTLPKSTINLNVTDGSASEKYSWETQDPGQFTITRTGGDNSKAETVYYTLGGTAKNSEDYNQLFGNVTFAAGSDRATIAITPIDDTAVEGNETVVVTLASNTAYNIGNSSSGTVAIADNDAPPAPFTNIGAILPGVADSSVDWGDYDNDGDLDILLTGYTGSSIISKVYRNDSGNFTDIKASLIGVAGGSAKWGDYDNDGDLDILLTGGNGSGGIAKVYQNKDGNFIDINASLKGGFSAEWGDYDNDGDLDILIAGYDGSAGVTKIYQNKDGSFIDSKVSLTGVTGMSVAWGDYDNDGDLDILLTGSDGSGGVAKVYQNKGGNFIDINASLIGLSNSSAEWGDYDNDGDLDILLTGFGSSGGVAKVYQNKGGNFVDINASLIGVGGSTTEWGDYDNDGDLDILITGQAAGNNVFVSKVYQNNGGSFVDINASLVNVLSKNDNSASWGDYDNDGDLDILITGISTSGNVSQIYRNNTTTSNTAPTAPTNLNSSVSGTSVALNWNQATDTQTPQNGLTYNLRVGTTPGGSDIMSPMSGSNGKRKVAQIGNVNQNTNWTLKNLKPGTYYWSVQAVDSAFVGSAFATQGSFTV